MHTVNQFLDTVQPAITFLTTHAILRYSLIVSILILLGVFFYLYYAQQQKTTEPIIDFQAIAGDDVNATQLDLAKAYLEMGQKTQAKTILRQTVKQGSKPHKNRARQLLKSL
ncbi:MAG: FimV/HubP family polar landmark protein [Pseudomonadota bacterium]